MESQFELRLGLIIPFSCLDLNFTFLSSFDSRSHVWFDLIGFRFLLFFCFSNYGMGEAGKERTGKDNITFKYDTKWDGRCTTVFSSFFFLTLFLICFSSLHPDYPSVSCLVACSCMCMGDGWVGTDGFRGFLSRLLFSFWISFFCLFFSFFCFYYIPWRTRYPPDFSREFWMKTDWLICLPDVDVDDWS